MSVSYQSKAGFPLGEFVRAKHEYDWLVMSSVFAASQSSCFFLCSREQIRLVENRLKLCRFGFFDFSCNNFGPVRASCNLTSCGSILEPVKLCSINKISLVSLVDLQEESIKLPKTLFSLQQILPAQFRHK